MNELPPEIEPTALHQGLQSAENFMLIDVREASEFANGALPGARLVPLSKLVTAPALMLPLETPIVVYCHHGVRSLKAREILREAGFLNVQSLRGGIDAWACEVDASVGRY